MACAWHVQVAIQAQSSGMVGLLPRGTALAQYVRSVLVFMTTPAAGHLARTHNSFGGGEAPPAALISFDDPTQVRSLSSPRRTPAGDAFTPAMRSHRPHAFTLARAAHASRAQSFRWVGSAERSTAAALRKLEAMHYDAFLSQVMCMACSSMRTPCTYAPVRPADPCMLEAMRCDALLSQHGGITGTAKGLGTAPTGHVRCGGGDALSNPRPPPRLGTCTYTRTRTRGATARAHTHS